MDTVLRLLKNVHLRISKVLWIMMNFLIVRKQWDLFLKKQRSIVYMMKQHVYLSKGEKYEH